MRDRIVIFGGMDGTTRYGDLWALSTGVTSSWTQLSPSGTTPRARDGHIAIYDPGRDRMLVFGGQHDSTEILNQASSMQWGGVVSAEADPAPPKFAVSAFAPNPSPRGAQLTIEIPSPARVRIRIYDMQGKLMAIPVDRSYPAGRHIVTWGGNTRTDTRVRAGLYHAEIHVGTERTVHRLVLVR